MPVMGTDGFDLRPGPWQPPAVIPAALAMEARAQLEWLDAHAMQPAETGDIRAWLLALGNAVAASSGLTAAAVEVKLSALLGLLDDYPAGTFSKAALRRAAKRFKFFPSFAELDDLLAEEAAELREKRKRLHTIATTRPGARAMLARQRQDDAPPPPATEEEKARVRECCASIGLPDPDERVKRMPGSQPR